MPSDYRFAQPLVARVMGAALAALGLVVVLLTVAVAVLSLPVAVLTAGVLLVVAGVLALGVLLTRGTFVMRLDDDGYRVRHIRGAGVKQAGWRDVEDVVGTTIGGERCVVLRLRDGRTTTLPVRVLAVSVDVFVKDLQQHLNHGHGYRRIN